MLKIEFFWGLGWKWVILKSDNRSKNVFSGTEFDQLKFLDCAMQPLKPAFTIYPPSFPPAKSSSTVNQQFLA
jgi:hypothetical protein